ncbi:MAG: amylo-alpha-1,6-glucosidase [Anaerolineae bacterium]
MALSEMAQEIANLPDRWGEGTIFAFSGIDGPTETASGFVATAGSTPYHFLIHTPRRRCLQLAHQGEGTVLAATHDTLIVTWSSANAREAHGLTGDDELVATCTAWHTLTGQVPKGGYLALCFEPGSASGAPGETDDEECKELSSFFQVTWDPVHKDAVVLARQGERWALAYGETVNQAKVRTLAVLARELDEVLVPRLETYRNLPEIAVPGYARLFRKCVSVMRVNTLGPEGAIQQRWSTPDRVPHRHMWLWDSVFHSFGMNYLDPALAWDFLRAVLERQRDDGMIPHAMQVDGTTSRITQPPILAWGVWENYQHLHDPDRLAYALPRLEAYLEWNLTHRDANQNGLLEWFIAETPISRSGESGMDNSPRFDEAIRLDAVDFSTFQALDMANVARIAAMLGQHDKAAFWQERADRMAQRIHEQLWDPAKSFYCDRTMDGELSPVKAVSGFLPLMLNTIPEDHTAGLIEHLENPQTFGSAFPIPSVSLDDPAWSTDMWRGPTWINFDYLVIQGLLRQGQPDRAKTLRDAVLEYVDKYYQQYGVLFEFYDAKDEVPPVACDRKGARQTPYDIRVKMDSIRDYHWTAALTAALLFEDLEGV